MSQRHPIQSEALMFITTNVKRHKDLFADQACAREAVETLYRVQVQYPFFLHGFVVMPDHCHFLLFVPAPSSVSKIMNRYKMGVSHSIGIGPFWQPRFDLRIVDDGYAVLRYIHQNPVKAGIVERPEDYPWSSACGRWDIVGFDL